MVVAPVDGLPYLEQFAQHLARTAVLLRFAVCASVHPIVPVQVQVRLMGPPKTPLEYWPDNLVEESLEWPWG